MRTTLKKLDLNVDIASPGASDGTGTDANDTQYDLKKGPRKDLVRELLQKLDAALSSGTKSIEVETSGLQIVRDPGYPLPAAGAAAGAPVTPTVAAPATTATSSRTVESVSRPAPAVATSGTSDALEGVAEKTPKRSPKPAGPKTKVVKKKAEPAGPKKKAAPTRKGEPSTPRKRNTGKRGKRS